MNNNQRNIFGREADIAKALELLSQESLVTLVGPGGIGKTTLALAVQGQGVHAHSWFVSLASTFEPTAIGVARSIAQALGLRVDNPQSPQNTVIAFFQERMPGLLILDNFEHLIGGASFLSMILNECVDLKILVTSREGLQVKEEVCFDVPPLSLGSSIALFERRAFQMDGRFRVSAENKEIVTQICARLDGLPLALELAVSRLQIFSLDELNRRLEHRLQVLSRGSRTASVPQRQRTLRNTIAWSYDLLSQEEQQVFRFLSIFVGGATIHMVEIAWRLVASHNPLDGLALDDLASLCNKHLLVRTSEAGESRMMMLDIIREYALEKLREEGEETDVRQAHAAYMYQFIQEVSSSRSLDVEEENIHAALEWLLSVLGQLQDKDLHEGLQMIYTFVKCLGNYWEERGHNQEGFSYVMRLLAYVEQHNCQDAYLECYLVASKFALVRGQLERALSLAQTASQQGEGILQARAYLQMGTVEGQRHHFVQAEGYLSHAIAVFRTFEPEVVQEELAQALFLLGDVLADRGIKYDLAHQVLQESVEIFDRIGKKQLWGRARHHLSILCFYEGRLVEALEIGEQCLAEVRALGYPMPTAYLATWLAAFLLVEHKTESANRAEALLTESAEIFEHLENRHGVSWCLVHLARLAVFRKDVAQAHADYTRSLEIATAIGDLFLLYHCLDGLSEMLFASSVDDAIRLFSEAVAIREAAGLTLPPMYTNYQKRFYALHPAMETSQSWADGQRAASERLLKAGFAQALPQKEGPLPQLTSREREVLRLLAQGLQNKEIGKQLSISTRTVEAHLRSIYEKLEVGTRSAATRIAIEMRL